LREEFKRRFGRRQGGRGRARGGIERKELHHRGHRVAAEEAESTRKNFQGGGRKKRETREHSPFEAQDKPFESQGKQE